MRSAIHLYRACLAISCAAAPAAAWAQETVLVEQPQIPDYDRGRNTGVNERARPDYDAIGIRRGSFLVYPRVQLGVGASDNVYLTETDRDADAYALIAPGVTATSDWSRHQLTVSGNAALRRYAENSPRNQSEWNLSALGRADFGSNLSVTVEVQGARVQESPFSGAVAANVAALSAYDRQLLGARAQYTSGRSRVTLAYDYNEFDFDQLTFSNGATLSQADRDRQFHRILIQGERALSPSLSTFAQVGYGLTDYDRPLLNGLVNRDSRAVRVLGGLHFDLSAFMRGSLGVGYVHRAYRSPLYRDVSGLSIEGRVEYFPDELTSVTLNLRRILDDSSIAGTSAFFNNEIVIRADREVRANLLLNLSAAFSRQDYLDSPFSSDVFRVGSGARYLMSRSLQLQTNLGYGTRAQPLQFGTGTVREFAGEFGLVLQR